MCTFASPVVCNVALLTTSMYTNAGTVTSIIDEPNAALLALLSPRKPTNTMRLSQHMFASVILHLHHVADLLVLYKSTFQQLRVCASICRMPCIC